jgi:hypothetical protein
MDETEIKWANAAELGHMKEQIALSKGDHVRISEFLVIKNEITYNTNLEKLKEYFLTVPNSKLFMDTLQPINQNINVEWQRWFPIEQTPKTHILHASYLRIPSTKFSFRNDPHIGLPIPDIFYRAENILGAKINYILGNLDTFYYIVRPFGYKFPDRISDGPIQFRLFDISNPQYVKLSRPESRWRGAPTPIIKDGKIQQMMNDKEYMAAYKKYLFDLELNLRRRIN